MSDPSLLGPAHLERLAPLSMKVAVPTWIPEGFQVAEVLAEVDADWGDTYQIRLTHEAGGEIVIAGAAFGIGDVFRGESRSQFNCPALGPGVLEHYPPDSDEGVDFRSHWLQHAPDSPAWGVSGKGLSVEDALRVAESLTFLA